MESFEDKIVKELEEDWVKLLVLLLDLFVSMILSIVTVSESNHLARNESSDPNECGPNGTNLTSNQAKASLGLFVTGGLLYILIIAVYYIYKICKLHCRRSTVQKVFIRRHTWVVIGGFCFYVGDNLPIPICNSSRVEAVFGIIMLSIATVTYLPVLINFTRTHDKGVQTEEQIEEEQETNKRLLQEVRSNQSKREEKKNILADCISLLVKMWKKISACVVILANMMKKIPPVAILLLAKMTSLDVVYTAIERAVSTHCDINDRCAQKNGDNNVTNYVAWVYWAVYIIVFFILCFYELWTYENEEAEKSIPAQGENTALENMNGERTTGNNLKQYMKCTTILMIVIAFLVSMFAGSYILADTRLPLACTVATKNKENWIRFGLWVFNVSSAVVVIILWICWQRIHDKRRKMKSKRMEGLTEEEGGGDTVRLDQNELGTNGRRRIINN